MTTIIRQNIINMLGPMDIICPDGFVWFEEECLPSDTHKIIYYRFLEDAESSYEKRDWLLKFYGDIELEHDYIDLLWYHIKVQPFETADEWHDEVMENLPNADEVLEAIQIKYQNWYYDESYNRVGRERAYDSNNPWWEEKVLHDD